MKENFIVASPARRTVRKHQRCRGRLWVRWRGGV